MIEVEILRFRNEKKVTIIDYGVGNTKSLKMVFNKLDIDAILTSDKDDIINSKYIVLPGVGAFVMQWKIKNLD